MPIGSWEALTQNPSSVAKRVECASCIAGAFSGLRIRRKEVSRESGGNPATAPIADKERGIYPAGPCGKPTDCGGAAPRTKVRAPLFSILHKERGIYPAGPCGNPPAYGKHQRRFGQGRCCNAI